MRTLVVNALRVLGKPTGPGRHIEFLAQQWSQMAVPFDLVILMSPGVPRIELPGSQTQIEFRAFGTRWPRVAWEQVRLPIAARGASMLFCPTYTGPVLHAGPMVVANHGIYESVPGEFSTWARIRATPVNRASARRAERVIANSMSTRDDLVRHFHIAPEDIDIVYPAAHDLFYRAYTRDEIDAEIARVFGQPVPYVIFIGKLARRRNVPNLIRAFSVVRRTLALPHRLLIVGPNTTDTAVPELAAEAGVADCVTHLPYLEQLPLAKLCAGAELYALPTTYEGISQTMFEAMASGTPVLTVDHPTLAEGGADAVYSMPSPSVDDLARGLTALLTNADLRREYSRRGRERAAKFSWRAAAEQTMMILDRYARPGDSRRI